jgi:hypothetical protein
MQYNAVIDVTWIWQPHRSGKVFRKLVVGVLLRLL